jgi:hypothetical protein
MSFLNRRVPDRPTQPPIMELPGFSVVIIGESVHITDPDNDVVAFLGPGKHAKYPNLHYVIQQHIQDWRNEHK